MCYGAIFSHSGSSKVLDAGKHCYPTCTAFLDLMPLNQVIVLPGIFSILALSSCFLHCFGLWTSEEMWGKGKDTGSR